MAPRFSLHRWASAHPTLRKAGITAGVAVGVLFLVLLLSLLFMDWNAFRGPVARIASARLGRPVQIQGDLQAHLFSLTPTITANGLTIGNPPWAGGGSLARVGRLAVRIELLPLLHGSLVLRSLSIDHPQLNLTRDAEGRANWVSANPKKAQGGGPPRLPPIQHFDVRAGEATFRDAKRGLDFRGTFAASETAASKAGEAGEAGKAGEAGNTTRPFRFDAAGVVNGERLQLAMRGAPLANVQPHQAYPFDVQVEAGETRLIAHGSLPRPFDLTHASAAFDIRGDDMANVYYISGLSFPNTSPYHLSGRLTRRVAHVTFQDLSGTIGASDMRGDLSIDLTGDRPFVRAKVTSRSLNLDDVAAWFGARKKLPAAEPGAARHASIAADRGARAATSRGEPAGVANGRLFPDAKLEAMRMRVMNAEVSYVADAVRSGRFPIRAASLALKLQDGVLRLAPVSLSLPEGRIEGTVRIDARGDVAKTELDARLLGVKLSQFKPKQSPEAPLDGVLRGRVKLEGRGNSVHDFVASSDGAATFVVPQGEVREAFAELTGIDVARGLGLLLSKDQDKTAVRCAVADLKGRNGTLTVQNMVFDTHNVLITGRGDVALGPEQLDLTLEGKPKKLRLFRLKSPIAVRGSLRHPSVGLDADSKAVGQGGIAAVLGALVTPLAAVFAFVDPGLAKDANCAALLTEARSDGAPVKTAEIHDASDR